MILMRLNTFDAEQEVKIAKEMLENSSALFTTYELVVLIYPESRKAKRIYTANSLPVYDREESIEKSVIRFCENEVDPADQERYLRFMDFNTMPERLRNSPKQFIQGIFRMKLQRDQSKWYTARITQVPTAAETVFMLTIQSIQGNLNRWIDAFIEEHPEIL